MSHDQDPKTSLPPLSKMISPNQSHSNLNSQQQSTQAQQQSLFYHPSQNPTMLENSIMRSINDYSNPNQSNTYISNANGNPNNNSAASSLYSSINQLRSSNTSGTNSPTQFSLPTHSQAYQLDNLDSNDYVKSRQSPLIPNYYQGMQQSKMMNPQSFDYRVTQQQQSTQQVQQQNQQQVPQNINLGMNMGMNLGMNMMGQIQHPQANILQGAYPTAPEAQNANIPTKCTCKQNDSKRIPRPRNAFILFRQKHHLALIEEGNQVKSNPEVSKELGRRWRALEPAEKDYWNNLAEEEKRLHAEKYPGYKYTPKRNNKKKCDYCIYKQNLKTQMAEKAAQRRAQKEQKRLEKQYHHQMMQQKQQQKQLLKQQQQQQKFSAQKPQHQKMISPPQDQKQQLHSPVLQQISQQSDFADQYNNPIASAVFNDMNLSNYQKYSQQVQQMRSSNATPSQQPQHQNQQPSNPFYSSTVSSQYQQQQTQNQSHVMPQQQQQQQYSNNFNNTLMSNSNSSYRTSNNVNNNGTNYQNSTTNSSSASTVTTTTANSIFTNQMHPSRTNTPVDYQNFDIKQQDHQQQQQQSSDQQTQSTVLPSINDLSLPPLNINQ